MLDIKMIRENTDEVIRRLNQRGGDYAHLKAMLKQDEERRDIIQKVQALKQTRNEASKRIGIMKQEGRDVSPLMQDIEEDKKTIQAYEQKLKIIEDDIHQTLLMTPNLPHADIPVGKDESANPLIRTVGSNQTLNKRPIPHWETAANLGLLDFERAAKITCSRFVVYKGMGARLERALMNFMLDLHREEHGYQEIILPYIVNYDSMVGSGQFPKFVEEAFKLVDNRNLYLNPTAEVPGINMHRDETLTIEELPIKYAAFTTAFRQEAGSAGRDTRGIIRLHQFSKVELLKFTTPETSYDELDKMLANSERVLKLLELPYRVIELCSGDLGFSMAKTYDIEVWLPSYETYREIGSISNAETYQARRANIKFKRTKDSKPEFVHTLNGSGLAIGRTVVAILENYLQEDGSVKVPEVLIPYMKTDRIK